MQFSERACRPRLLSLSMTVEPAARKTGNSERGMAFTSKQQMRCGIPAFPNLLIFYKSKHSTHICFSFYTAAKDWSADAVPACSAGRGARAAKSAKN
jgi:hypothetical protein